MHKRGQQSLKNSRCNSTHPLSFVLAHLNLSYLWLIAFLHRGEPVISHCSTTLQLISLRESRPTLGWIAYFRALKYLYVFTLWVARWISSLCVSCHPQRHRHLIWFLELQKIGQSHHICAQKAVMSHKNNKTERKTGKNRNSCDFNASSSANDQFIRWSQVRSFPTSSKNQLIYKTLMTRGSLMHSFQLKSRVQDVTQSNKVKLSIPNVSKNQQKPWNENNKNTCEGFNHYYEKCSALTH